MTKADTLTQLRASLAFLATGLRLTPENAILKIESPCQGCAKPPPITPLPAVSSSDAEITQRQNPATQYVPAPSAERR